MRHDDSEPESVTRLPRDLEPAFAVEFRYDCQRLRHNLIHVVVLICRETPDKMHIRRRLRKRFILLVENRILRTRHRIIRVAFGPWELVYDCGFRDAVGRSDI